MAQMYVNFFFAKRRLSSTDNLCKQFDLDQDRHSVGPDLDKKLCDTMIVFLTDVFEKVIFF